MEQINPVVLENGITSRFIEGINGLRIHFLEAGDAGRPLVLLLHGFPELAYSWRKIMGPLADFGYYVVAPDQRGYGRTTGWSAKYEEDLSPFGMLNLTQDVLALAHALGYETVFAVVGHDFGSSVAAYCGVIRPDVFNNVVLMSAPFEGPPTLRIANDLGTREATTNSDRPDIDIGLAGLSRPRKHYHRYYSTRHANDDMLNCTQGVKDFLRGYFHAKSADWSGNEPFRLAEWIAEDLAQMPTYYIMELEKNMAETAASYMPTPEAIADCKWLLEDELTFYAMEFSRTGFQGGLNWYRCRFDLHLSESLYLFSGRTIDVPSIFISGDKDWGVYQRPGALEAMRDRVCTHMEGAYLLPGAGHWVQQEKPKDVTYLIREFLS